MGTKKKNTYVDFELEWLENKALELKQYIDDRDRKSTRLNSSH